MGPHLIRVNSGESNSVTGSLDSSTHSAPHTASQSSHFHTGSQGMRRFALVWVTGSRATTRDSTCAVHKNGPRSGDSKGGALGRKAPDRGRVCVAPAGVALVGTERWACVCKKTCVINQIILGIICPDTSVRSRLGCMLLTCVEVRETSPMATGGRESKMHPENDKFTGRDESPRQGCVPSKEPSQPEPRETHAENAPTGARTHLCCKHTHTHGYPRAPLCSAGSPASCCSGHLRREEGWELSLKVGVQDTQPLSQAEHPTSGQGDTVLRLEAVQILTPRATAGWGVLTLSNWVSRTSRESSGRMKLPLRALE